MALKELLDKRCVRIFIFVLGMVLYGSVFALLRYRVPKMTGAQLLGDIILEFLVCVVLVIGIVGNAVFSSVNGRIGAGCAAFGLMVLAQGELAFFVSMLSLRGPRFIIFGVLTAMYAAVGLPSTLVGFCVLTNKPPVRVAFTIFVLYLLAKCPALIVSCFKQF
jgi:hypothetical protein